MNELILLTEFWKNQTLENYLNCQDYFYKSKLFDPFEKYVEKLKFYYSENNYQQVLNSVTETMQLSLFVLQKISNASQKLKQNEDAVKYFTRATEVAQIILESGDGSIEKPYQIIYNSDCKEIIAYLSDTYKSHEIIHAFDKILEAVTTDSNHIYHFDITHLSKCKDNAVQNKVNDIINWYEKNTNRPI